MMNQSEFLANAYNLFKARGKLCIQGTTIGFGSSSHWLKNWFEICK